MPGGVPEVVPVDGLTTRQRRQRPLLIIHTDSTVYQSSLAGVINSSTVNVATFAPLAVPEPTAAVLLLIGTLSLAVRRKS